MKPRSLIRGTLLLLLAAHSTPLLVATTTSADESPAYKNTNTNAAVNETNSSDHTTTGNYSDAIFLITSSGAITFVNSGNLTTGTKGNRAKGSYSSGIDARNSGTGGIYLTNSGNITTHGDHAAGISANVSGTGGHIHVTHQAGAGILTTGTFDGNPAWEYGGVPAGIIATNGNGKTGNITITADGDIETAGAGNRLHGIYALSSTAEGSTNITIRGSIKTGQRTPVVSGEPAPITNDSLGNHSNNGIVTSAKSTSMVTVDGGRIETQSDNSIGISSGNIGATGNAVIKINSGSVTTRGHGSRAISAYVSSGSGNVQITSNGTITTEGSARIMQYNGTTSYSHAIYLSNSGTGQSILALGEDSVVTTRGDHARGVTATTASGAIFLGYSHTFLQGSITTTGNASSGIYAQSTSGTVSINNNADVTTSGSSAVGIYATGSKEISIVNSGDILTQGQYSGGISGYATGSGDLVITHMAGASLITEGEFCAPPANWLYGEVPAGIIASNTSNSTGNIVINAHGDIETRGEGNRLRGIYAFNNNSAGDTTINASGNITTGRETPDGAVLDDDLTGRHSNNGIVAGSKKHTTVNYSTGTLCTNSDLSTAISIASSGTTGNAKINIESGTILALGDGSSGLYAGVSSSTGTGNAIIHNNGSVTTQGAKRPQESNGSMYYAHGIRANNAGTGDAVITTGSDSVVRTAGEEAYGIYAASQSGSVLMGSSSDYLKGSVTTTGNGSHGLYSTTATGSSMVYNAATVSTAGGDSHGAVFESTGGRAEFYNAAAGSVSGGIGVYVGSGVNGGVVQNRGAIYGMGGNAIVVDGRNMVIDVTTSSVETGKYIANNNHNSIRLGGETSSRALNELGGSSYFDSITKTGAGEWVIDKDSLLSGEVAIAISHEAGRLAVEANVGFVGAGGTSVIHSGATLAGAGSINNDVRFEDNAVFEVDLMRAYHEGSNTADVHMVVRSGELDGRISLINFSDIPLLDIDTCIVVMESTDMSGMTGHFDWLQGQERQYGGNIFEMVYTENQVQLWVRYNTGNIPEPATAALSALGLGLALLLRRRSV